MFRDFPVEVETRVARDQDMRFKAFDGRGEWDPNIDTENTEWLRAVVMEHGWPKISEIGTNLSSKVWLLVQHADRDLEFQKYCHELMKALPDGEVSLHDIAYLEDRILVSEGKPQLYGSQFHGKGEVFEVREIADLDQVDVRRAAMGLGPFQKDYDMMVERYRE